MSDSDQPSICPSLMKPYFDLHSDLFPTNQQPLLETPRVRIFTETNNSFTQANTTLPCSEQQSNLVANFNCSRYHTARVFDNESLQRKKMSDNDSLQRKKISQLQREILMLKKQSSQRECSFHKQRSVLLNRIQLSSMQIAELKQRHANLVQINQAITDALQNKGVQEKESKKEYERARVMAKQLEESARSVKQMRMALDNAQKEVGKLKEEHQRRITEMSIEHHKKVSQIIVDYQKKIALLGAENDRRVEHARKQAEEQCSNKARSAVNAVNQLPLSQTILTRVAKVLSTHFWPNLHCSPKHRTEQSQLCKYSNQQGTYLLEDISLTLQEPQQRRSNKKIIIINRNNRNANCNNNTNCNRKDNLRMSASTRSRLIYRNNQQQPSPVSPASRYLCQLCQKAYQQRQFIEHMSQCQQMEELQQHRQIIENTLTSLGKQQSYSNQKNSSRASKKRLELSEIFPHNTTASKANMGKCRNNSQLGNGQKERSQSIKELRKMVNVLTQAATYRQNEQSMYQRSEKHSYY